MLANLSPDTGLLFQVADTEKRLSEQQLKLGIVLALGLSLLVHFFLLLFIFPALSIDSSMSGERKVLELSLIERAKAPSTVESKTTDELTESAPPPETRVVQETPLKEQAKEEPGPLFFPSAPGSSTSEMQTERIFNPRLRQQFYNAKPKPRNYETERRTEVYGSQYYDLGNGECLREMDNYGIASRDSEEFLIYNVRKVACPGSANESEGDAMVRGLRAALAKNK